MASSTLSIPTTIDITERDDEEVEVDEGKIEALPSTPTLPISRKRPKTNAPGPKSVHMSNEAVSSMRDKIRRLESEKRALVEQKNDLDHKLVAAYHDVSKALVFASIHRAAYDSLMFTFNQQRSNATLLFDCTRTRCAIPHCESTSAMILLHRYKCDIPTPPGAPTGHYCCSSCLERMIVEAAKIGRKGSIECPLCKRTVNTSNCAGSEIEFISEQSPAAWIADQPSKTPTEIFASFRSTDQLEMVSDAHALSRLRVPNVLTANEIGDYTRLLATDEDDIRPAESVLADILDNHSQNAQRP